MVKIEEIRIRNLVQYGDAVLAVKAVYDGDDNNRPFVECTELIGVAYDYEIEPILLTEKVLEACGFEKIPHFTITNPYIIGIGRGRVLSVSDIDNANQMAWLQKVEGICVTNLVCVHNYDYDGRMYFHQLQNLFFALTQTELPIDIEKLKEAVK